MDWIMKEAQALMPELIDHRRWLHQHAEVGFDLPETTRYVRQALEAMGIQVNPCGKSGLTAVLGQGEQTILLRADMDALPMEEESDEDFRCTTGAMHACGHDFHTAMLLGAAKLLKAHEKELPRKVKLMFQPAEELLEGARDMLEGGVLEDPTPDQAVMLHVMTGVPLPAGTVLPAPPGVSAPAADCFTVTVQGKGCHGSMPHTGRDPLTVCARILLGLQELHTRELPADDGSVLTVGTVQGGTASNVIADKATLSGTLRSYSEETRSYLKTRLETITHSMAQAYCTNATVTFDSGCPTLVNRRELGEHLENVLKQTLGTQRVRTAKEMGAPVRGGSEDFAYVSHRIPTQMLALAAGDSSQGYPHPLHHPKVRFDETALPIGTAALIACAIAKQKPSQTP